MILLKKEFPDVGLLEWQDPETGERICMDTSSAWFRQTYQWILQTKIKSKTLRSAGIDHINISVGDDYVTPFISFLKTRSKVNSQKVEDLSIKEELAKYPVWSCDLEKTIET